MEPGRAVERDPDRTLRHLVVGDIAPAVEDGRYAVKRLVGDGLRIGADIFTDGHDVLACRVPDESSWLTVGRYVGAAATAARRKSSAG